MSPNLAKLILRASSAGSSTPGRYRLPALPFAYDALEPVISSDTLKVHHQAHHGTYVKNLNDALDRLEQHRQDGSISKQIQAMDLVRFNGGGHINHSLYWENLRAFDRENVDNMPEGEIEKMLRREWKSFDRFKDTFIRQAAAIQGSGYGWLGYRPSTGAVEFATTGNQDLLEASGLVPLLTVDVWEHAYYLQYRNVRMEYLKNVWKVVDWRCVNRRLEAALSIVE